MKRKDFTKIAIKMGNLGMFPGQTLPTEGVLKNIETDDVVAERFNPEGIDVDPYMPEVYLDKESRTGYSMSTESGKQEVTPGDWIMKIDLSKFTKGLTKWQKCQECGMPATYGDGKTWARCNPHQYEHDEKVSITKE